MDTHPTGPATVVEISADGEPVGAAVDQVQDVDLLPVVEILADGERSALPGMPDCIV